MVAQLSPPGRRRDLPGWQLRTFRSIGKFLGRYWRHDENFVLVVPLVPWSTGDNHKDTETQRKPANQRSFNAGLLCVSVSLWLHPCSKMGYQGPPWLVGLVYTPNWVAKSSIFFAAKSTATRGA